MPFKVIQNHQFWYRSKACIQLPVSECTNLHPISHRFQVIADYRSKFLLSTEGGISLQRMHSGWTPKFWYL